jgi:hypothetical protein
MLHEPFCSSAPGDISMARCLNSARAILSQIYLLWSSSFDIAVLQPCLNFIWSVVSSDLSSLLCQMLTGLETQGWPNACAGLGYEAGGERHGGPGDASDGTKRSPVGHDVLWFTFATGQYVVFHVFGMALWLIRPILKLLSPTRCGV